MKAIIMAGGEGTRLRPLTCTRPKPMVYLANKPVMTHGIELLKKHGITQIGVTVQYLSSQIINYYGDGSEYGVNLRYFSEDVPLGTAGSVKNAEEFLDETFLVISGDALTDIDLTAAVNFHRQKGSLATIILSSVDNPLEYGIIISKPTGEIVRFLEKPSWGEVFSDQVNTGMYILEPEALKYIPDKTFFDFSKNLFPLLMEKGQPLYGYEGKGYWCDIGNTQAYLEANWDIMLNRVKVNLPYKQYLPGIWVGKNTEIDPTAQLEAPLIIGNNCEIGPGTYLGNSSIIADNCKIGEGASLKKSVLWKGVRLGNRVQVRGTVLCSQVQVKEDSSVYEGAIVGEQSLIKEKCVIKPGVKIWPGKIVEEGTVFKDNLVWGSKSSSKIFGQRGVKGELNWDLPLGLLLNLGAAFGSLSASGSKIGISGNEHPAAQLVKGVLSSGLQAVGKQVYDLGEATGPMTRIAIRANELQGGVNIFYEQEEENVRISFFNAKGADLNKNQVKKVETILALDDFSFITARRIKSLTVLPGIYNSYFADLAKKIGTNLPLKVVYSCPCPKLSAHFGGYLLNELGCQVRETERSRIGETVKITKADLGISLDEQGEKIMLYDERGSLLDEDRLKILLVYLLLKGNKNMTVVVPVDAPSVLEQLANILFQGGKKFFSFFS
jgi:mannose-1-phosphate guanylyltransferase/phosphomannomutase